jgi:hypothetical protein
MNTPTSHRPPGLVRRAFRLACLALAGMGLAPGTSAANAPDLAAPIRLTAGGQPIDVEVGHAAPWVADFDGDGLPDLLVGQFGNGKLRLYRNRGTEKAPEFSTFAWFQAGGADARVPAG